MRYQTLLNHLRPIGIGEIARHTKPREGEGEDHFVYIARHSEVEFPRILGPVHMFYAPDNSRDFELDDEEVLAALRRLKLEPSDIGL